MMPYWDLSDGVAKSFTSSNKKEQCETKLKKELAKKIFTDVFAKKRIIIIIIISAN